MNNLEKKLNNEILHEKDSKCALSVIKVQFDKFIHLKMLKSSNYDSNAREARQDFKDYTQMEALSFKDLIIQHMEYIEQCIVERARHEQEIHNRIVSDKGNDQGLENQSNTSKDESSGLKNECNDKSTSGDDTDIKPSYDTKLMVEVPYTAKYNVLDVDTKHYEQHGCIINTCVVEKVDSNVIPDSPDMYDNEIQTDQNDVECDDERAAIANLIANLKLDIDEYKNIQKQLKKANASLTQKLKEYKSTLAETSRTLGESNSIRDRLLAQKEIDIKEGLKLKAYEISVVKEKHDELVKQSLLTKSHYEGLVKETTKTQKDSFTFVHELKQEMHVDLKYVKFLKNEIDELESDKAEFSNMYDILFARMKSPKHVSFQSQRESVGSNDMVHNYYLEEAKKKAQLQKDKALNTKPSVQQSARLPNTANVVAVWYTVLAVCQSRSVQCSSGLLFLTAKLLEDLKELAEYKESLENSSKEIATSNSNKEKEEPQQDSDIRQLIREECCVEVCEE
uniref:Uncharacterized protein n=1 Tax=Tanacetum cinerariifolium TaxID=118510 RepID=A0A6L2KFR9_TANCI|nr:hypothetical protein [Tanacetum cinerariifolium]